MRFAPAQYAAKDIGWEVEQQHAAVLATIDFRLVDQPLNLQVCFKPCCKLIDVFHAVELRRWDQSAVSAQHNCSWTSRRHR